MKVDLSFETITQAIQQLDLPAFDVVVGIGRGGVVPASLLAYKLQTGLTIIRLNHRDDDNRPRYETPILHSPADLPVGIRTVLLVDDVSVSGKTLDAAKRVLDGHDITTLVLKGRADVVVFPEIKACVNWPWHPAHTEQAALTDGP